MAFFISKTNITLIGKIIQKGNTVSSHEEALDIIRETKNKKIIVSFVNMYAIQLALKDEKFRNAILNSNFIFFDGIALKVLCLLLKLPYGFNMNGTDFIPFLIEAYKEKSFAVYASNQEALNLFINKYRHLNLLSTKNGFFNAEVYVHDASEVQPEIIVLGMGMPKQELIAEKIKSQSIIINGGAIIDYLSEYKVRANQILINLKLEWLYRIFYEPKRLFYRYFEGGVLLFRIFLTNVFKR
jgi:exopolysaccharide biosynthesis WecB/TagA/CpsF family protein